MANVIKGLGIVCWPGWVGVERDRACVLAAMMIDRPDASVKLHHSPL